MCLFVLFDSSKQSGSGVNTYNERSIVFLNLISAYENCKLQAKSLGIDLNPRPTQGTEDTPVYEAPYPGGAGALAQVTIPEDCKNNVKSMCFTNLCSTACFQVTNVKFARQCEIKALPYMP